MASATLIPAAALLAAVLSASCVFGGDDDAPEETPTEAPAGTEETPTAESDDATSDDTAAGENGEDGDGAGSGTPGTYTVQAGDMLATIAERFGVTVDELVEANNIEDPNVILVGQELVIPGAEEGDAVEVDEGDEEE